MPSAFGRYKEMFRVKAAVRVSSLIAQLVKNHPAMQETLVRFLGWEDPLK